MKSIFLILQKYLLAQLADFQPTPITFIRIWNNNVEWLEQGKDEVSYSLPAIFIEFVSPLNWKQIGNGVQTLDDLHIKIHYVMEQLDAADGTMSQNLDVLADAETLFTIIEDQYLANIPIGVLTRVGEIMDDNHDNIYHFVQEYETTWVDSAMNRPVKGKLSVPPLELQLQIINQENTITNIYYYN